MTSPWLSVRHPLDRLIAAIVGLLTLPFVGVLAAVARRSSPGPAMVRLARIGRHGRPFEMMKLRTMRTDRRDGLATGGALTTGRHDPRITTLGRYLRVSRLDELPQLLHVVAGTMAVIGPRPEAVAYVDLDDPRWRAVLRARPGIAGPSQVLFRHWEERVLTDASSSGDIHDVDVVYGDVVLPLKLAVDEWYVRNASPLVDAVIIAGLAEQYILLRATTVAHEWFRKRIPELDSAGFMDGRRGGIRSSPRPRSS